MKKLIMAALAAVLASGAASAQNNNNHHGGPGNPPPPNNHGPVNPNPHPAPAVVHGPGPGPVHPGPVVVHPGPQPHGGPVVPARNMGGGGRHHLPPGISIPTAHHSAPMWHGRSWGVGDVFIMTGFDGPSVSDWSDYGLSSPRRGTHWIYVDGYYLLIGNRTGRIFAEVPADY